MPRWVFAAAGSLIVHEVAYFLAFAPFFIADFFPSLRKYKIQPNKVNDKTQMWKCFKRLMFLHFVIELPMMIMSHPILTFLGMTMELPLPSLSSILTMCAASFFIEDLYFYWVHRLLHYGWFYKNIHKVHHDHQAPFGIAAEYAHPIETVVLGFGTLIGPYIFARHLISLWIWVVVRVFQTVEVHSGYDFPISLNRWVPFWGGAKFHDYHHETFVGNYSSTFTIWDWMFGTDKSYRSRLAERERKAKAAADKPSTPVEATQKAKTPLTVVIPDPTASSDAARRSPRLAKRTLKP
jgi:sterol desaturase/sphingolipid hydroxylase (fatty acid hydroxylase superfamily)